MNMSIKDNCINIDGIDINAEAIEKVMNICHKYKHLYLDGYPHGRGTRKKLAETGVVFKKWRNSPHICISYIIRKSSENGLSIEAIVANKEKIKNKYSDEELRLFLYNWQQDVAENIEPMFT